MEEKRNDEKKTHLRDARYACGGIAACDTQRLRQKCSRTAGDRACCHRAGITFHTWQTASIGYADDGSMQPEYYVRFSDSDILYGHLKNGQFVLDHSDKIVALEETPTGGFRVQAQASNGAQYTFRTCESDDTILEYYETWREEEFAEMYRGGASLSRCS